jgi:hypothetical protein
MDGTVTLTATIDAKGWVTAVGGKSQALAPVLPCLKAVVASGGFSQPKGGAATILIPLSFARR